MASNLREQTEALLKQEAKLREGGGPSGHQRQRDLGRLVVRERLEQLLDVGAPFLEIGLWGAWQMYPQWGEVPAAGVVTGIGQVQQRPVMVVANDATVKAGAFFPQTVKKVLRAQRIAESFRLPLLYLVDSAGVFLPLQDEIFPDEDDFGRIFRNNAVFAEKGIPQYAAVMGNCIAGGAYLPVLCDQLLMTEGSQMCLAGQSLVKAAIGQDADAEQLGGAEMHASISGTVDFREPNDEACLQRLRSLVDLLPPPREHATDIPSPNTAEVFQSHQDTRDLLNCIVDPGSLQEYKAEYGPTLITAFAKVGGRAIGLVANQRNRCRNAKNQWQIGGVIYCDSVEKAARFVRECSQTRLPIVFFQDVQGFMVGVESEQSGIIRHGADLVRAVSTTQTPKITVITGGSFGAGNYALCGKAYDPWLILAWPSAQYAVMGAGSAAKTLTDLKVRDAQRRGETITDQAKAAMHEEVAQKYQQQMDIRYGAARGWVDAIIPPDATRLWLEHALRIIER